MNGKLVLATAACAALLVSGCGDSTGADDCPNIAGNVIQTGANTCVGAGSGRLTVTQTGCDFIGTFDITPFPPVTMQGRLVGNAGSFALNFAPLPGGACSGTGTGTLTVDGNRVTGTFSANQPGIGCCGTYTGTFSYNK